MKRPAEIAETTQATLNDLHESIDKAFEDAVRFGDIYNVGGEFFVPYHLSRTEEVLVRKYLWQYGWRLDQCYLVVADPENCTGQRTRLQITTVSEES